MFCGCVGFWKYPLCLVGEGSDVGRILVAPFGAGWTLHGKSPSVWKGRFRDFSLNDAFMIKQISSSGKFWIQKTAPLFSWDCFFCSFLPLTLWATVPCGGFWVPWRGFSICRRCRLGKFLPFCVPGRDSGIRSRRRGRECPCRDRQMRRNG